MTILIECLVFAGVFAGVVAAAKAVDGWVMRRRIARRLAL
jgi:hypothetical protein